MNSGGVGYAAGASFNMSGGLEGTAAGASVNMSGGGVQSTDERLRAFREAAMTRAKERGVSPSDHNWNLFSVAGDAGLNLFNFSKDAEFINSLWLCFLSVMREHFNPSGFKFPTIRDFLAPGAYPEFAKCNLVEQNKLWTTANWMAILFTMIPAAKNKGLVLQVIPQLIEGPYVKYITGSGQSKATANRVRIYEREGYIVVSQRAPRRKPLPGETLSKQPTKKMAPLKRGTDSVEPVGGVHMTNTGRGPGVMSMGLVGHYGEGVGGGIPSAPTATASGGTGKHPAPPGSRQTSGAESSNDESDDDEMQAEDEEEGGDVEFVEVLKLLRDSSNSAESAIQARSSGGLAGSGNGQFGANYTSMSGAGGNAMFPTAFSFLAGSDGTAIPGLCSAPHLERLNSWDVGVGQGALQRNLLLRLTTDDFQNQLSFPPGDHLRNLEAVSDLGEDMFSPLDPARRPPGTF